MRKISVYISRPKGMTHGNFGDELSLPIFDRILNVTAVPAAMHRAEMIAVGSLLDAFSRATWRRKLHMSIFSSRSPLHVWGSGFILENSALQWPRPTVIHAVRGKLSSERLSFDGAVGDPGILAARLISKRPLADAKVALVPHYLDRSIAEQIELPTSWKIVHPDGEPIDVISRIAASELVVSSSLHGLIVADAFGIPAVWARSTNDLFGKSDFKFFDHASARGRAFNDPQPYAKFVSMKFDDLNRLATTPNRDIDLWCDDLIQSFPFF